MSYSLARKFVKEAELETNNPYIADLFRIAKSKNINYFGKRRMIILLQRLQKTFGG